MIDRMFLAHPRKVGESYIEHLTSALGFAAELLVAAGACATHALVPALFEHAASGAVRRLHGRMVVRTQASRSASTLRNDVAAS